MCRKVNTTTYAGIICDSPRESYECNTLCFEKLFRHSNCERSVAGRISEKENSIMLSPKGVSISKNRTFFIEILHFVQDDDELRDAEKNENFRSNRGSVNVV